MQVSSWLWVLFAALVLALLAVDLAFAVIILVVYGAAPALTYLTAYVLEKSLSVDNVFVFVLIFSELRIPAEQQRRVLYWGVLGALVVRAVLIAGGVFLLRRFQWVTYPFAALVIFAAVRLIWGREKERELVATACAVCGSWVARIIPITPVLRGGSFWVRQRGGLVATPLFIALVVVETTDVIFALDSIPAVFAVTSDLFLVYTSNVFAMLGLRSLYFLLAGVVERFRFLRAGLAAILAFVGVKLLLSGVVEIPTWVSLAVIATALTLAVAASVAIPRGMAQVPADGADRFSHPP
ncbi:MAG: TerC/Alx family metal homeostasis membrane protein [Deltaproteobacteria bacterium]|nr:MAG: TerC/Alx family metal homeostasis membrane protein [Deltaproteobacteria bacterium]